MEFFRIKRDIPFMRYALIFNVISLITFLVAVVSLRTKGLNFGVDFTGGTVMEVHYAQPADRQQDPRSHGQARLCRRGGAEFRHLARRADPPAGQAGRDQRPVVRDR